MLVLISPLFPSQYPCDKIFLHMSTDSTLQCEDIRSVQEIFVHATYVPFHQLPSVGLSGFFRKFSCMRRTYHFTNYMPNVGLPVNFCPRDVRTISPSTKCEASWFFQEFSCTRCTYHFTNYQVWGFPVFSGNFRARDVRTIHQLPSVGLPGFFRKISCTRRTYHVQPTILGLAQARPNKLKSDYCKSQHELNGL